MSVLYLTAQVNHYSFLQLTVFKGNMKHGVQNVSFLGFLQSCVFTFVHFSSCFRCDAGFFQRVCSCFAVKSKQEVQQLSSLLQLLDYNLSLTGWLTRGTCSSVGRVLGLCGSNVKLSLKPRKISTRGASLLLKHTSDIKSLRSVSFWYHQSVVLFKGTRVLPEYILFLSQVKH